jgi:hypothetical protein
MEVKKDITKATINGIAGEISMPDEGKYTNNPIGKSLNLPRDGERFEV